MELNLAFDISTTCVGICVYDNNANIHTLTHLKLESDKDVPVDNRYIVKAELFKNYITELKQKLEAENNATIKNIFIEEELFGSNNRFTANTLLKFNGITSYILFQIFNVYPRHISVHEIRKSFCPEFVTIKTNKKGEIEKTLSFPKTLDKKTYIWEKVCKLNPQIEWIYNKKGKLLKENFDMSDSVAVAQASIILNLI